MNQVIAFVFVLLAGSTVFAASKGSSSSGATSLGASSFFIEPFGGYAWGNHELNPSKSTATASYYGLRAGPKWGPLTAGLELSGFEGQIDLPAGKYKSWIGIYGAYVMLQFDFGLRLLGGFTFDNKFEYKDNPTTTGLYKGLGLRMGAGFRFGKNVALSFEYLGNTYDDYNAVKITDSNQKVRVDYAMVVLSFPFVIDEK